jgi:SPX domain protein involved in polyphosphate accumulation
MRFRFRGNETEDLESRSSSDARRLRDEPDGKERALVDRPTSEESGEQPSNSRSGDQSGRLRAPSSLHAFNRYELKYLVPSNQIGDIRAELNERMERDAYSGPRGYGVWSVYYDTSHLRFYYEKIEGLKFRRKLRIRRYGETGDVTDENSPVSVEIKQRVNRVTQKRRVILPYERALELCDRRERIEVTAADQPFVDEVLDLIIRLDLRPIAMTGYRREPYVGRDADLGLRVTLDHRVRGRDRDFDLRAETENRYIIRPDLAVMEVKVNERAPYWVTDMAARYGLQIQRISKYCQSVEVHDLAPRSVFHVPEDQQVLSA